MIYIATVHWQTDRWIPIQLEYLRRHVGTEYRLYAWMNGISESYRAHCHFACFQPVVSHAIKLNILADFICQDAADDDILLFLDGDAFPIRPLRPALEQWLSNSKLAAIQRLENDGDPQPHPSFCATTVRFWRTLPGTWLPGYKWKSASGREVTDVGGNLLEALRKGGIQWEALRRTSGDQPHPLYFGVYADLVYHHGAGFRRPITRHDINGTNLARLFDATETLPARLRHLARRALFGRVVKKNRKLSSDMFRLIAGLPEHVDQNPIFAKTSGKSSARTMTANGVS